MNKIIRNFITITVFFSVLLSFEPTRANEPNEKCQEEKIRVELEKNFLEFNRSDVEVYVLNPNPIDSVNKYLDVSKNCSVETVQRVFSVSNIKINMPVRMSINSPSILYSTYFEYIKQHKIDLKNDKWIEVNKDVRHLAVDSNSGFYLINKDNDFEIDGSPILFSCVKWHGCSTSYIHPSGLGFWYRFLRMRTPESQYVKKIEEMNAMLDSMIIDRPITNKE